MHQLQSRLGNRSDWYPVPTGSPLLQNTQILFSSPKSFNTSITNKYYKRTSAVKPGFSHFFKIRTYKYSRLKDTAGRHAPLPLITGGLANSHHWSPSPTGYLRRTGRPVGTGDPVGLGTSRTGYQSDWIPSRTGDQSKLGTQSDWVPVGPVNQSGLETQSDWVPVGTGDPVGPGTSRTGDQSKLGTSRTGHPVGTGDPVGLDIQSDREPSRTGHPVGPVPSSTVLVHP